MYSVVPTTTSLLVFLFLNHTCQGLSSKTPLLRRFRSIIPSNFPLALPWYEDGLEFSCTGCSKCCQVDGDVWLAPEEISNIIDYLAVSDDGGSNDLSSIDSFRKKYVRAEIGPSSSDSDSDIDESQSWMCLKRKKGSCVFLDSSGQCGIYDVRPVQCHTYPFWPSLLEDVEDWEDESVLPDDITIEEGTDDRHWSADLGGCEGIGRLIDAVAKVDEKNLKNVDLDQLIDEQREVVIVEREEIIAKRKEAKRHWDRFPGEEIKTTTWYL